MKTNIQNSLSLFMVLLLTVLFSCSEEEDFTPDIEGIAGIAKFSSSEVLEQTILTIKAGGHFSPDNNFKSLESIWSTYQQEHQKIMDAVASLGEITDKIVQENQMLFKSVQQDLEELNEQYEAHINFRDGHATGLIFKDAIMSKILNVDGMFIIGNRVFKYSNEEILSANFSSREEIGNIFNQGSSTEINTLQFPSPA